MRFALFALAILLFPLEAVAQTVPDAATVARTWSRAHSGSGSGSGPDCGQACRELRPKLVDVHVGLSVASAVSLFTASGFGLANRIALGSGMTKSDIAPTRWVHRIAAGTATGTYLASGVAAIAIPGLDGTLAGKAPGPQTPLGRRLHVGLSVAHFATLMGTLATGLIQANVLESGEAWEGTVTTHHVLASTTATLLILGAAVVFEL